MLKTSIVAIPEALLPRVPELLKSAGLESAGLGSAGIQVEGVPLHAGDDPRRFVQSLRCGTVCVSIQREPQIHSAGPILVIIPDNEGDAEETRFLVQSIEDALLRNGACIPTPASR